MPTREHGRRRGRWPLIAAVGCTSLLGVAVLGCVMAITGATFTCTGQAADSGGPGPAGPAATKIATAQIPAARLKLYQAAGRRFDIDWTFLASIGAQECNHGSCAGDNGYGCAGPMQIAMRRGSPCSPGGGPTEWERFGWDGNGDGRRDVNDPADAIFGAARILRFDKKAPPTGGSYAAYRQAACRYYGACADASASYADEVMARAVAYGFKGTGTPASTVDPDGQDADPPTATGGCGPLSATGAIDGTGSFGPVRRVRATRHLAPLPTSVTGGASIQCDARLITDVVWLARRFHVQVTACYAIHSTAGEHPLGAATDLVPAPGRSWPETTGRLAHAIGWKSTCASSGVAPTCARPPFRFAGYNGYPSHGDPAHCRPCGGGPHLHLSWLTSASPGQQENQSRTGYFAPSWIDTFTPQRGDTP